MGGGSTEALHKMIEKGMLGRKSGKGFFMYACGVTRRILCSR